jgi:hypothetical protein
MSTPLKPLTREEILAAADILSETVTVPEWGGTIIVRGLTGEERDEFEASCIRGKGRKTEVNYRNARAKLVVRSCYKPDGSRLFEEEDAPKLGKKGAAALSRVYEVAARLSGLTEDDLDELAKN